MNHHLALAAVKMQGEAPAVVQKEQSGVCLYVAKVGWEILPKTSLVYRTDSQFVADAVFGAHEFCAGVVGQFECLLQGGGSAGTIE